MKYIGLPFVSTSGLDPWVRPIPTVQSGLRGSECIGRAGQTDHRTGGRQWLSCHHFFN
jgi:hypothetical protein